MLPSTLTPETPGSGFLEKNLEAIRQVNKKTAEWLGAEPERPNVELIYGPEGIPNLMIKHGPRKFAAYDLQDPLTKPRQAIKDFNRYKENLSIVIGLGLGYRVQAIIEEMEEGHHILVIEPNQAMARLALTINDFSKVLASGSLVIAGPGTGEVAEAVFLMEPFLNRGDVHMAIEDYTHHLGGDYVPLAEHVKRVLNQIRSNNATVYSKGMEIACNEIESLPYVIRSRGVGELSGMFKGVPAILIGTGPSLGKNIHLLKKLQDRAVIIAVAQALRSLLAYGIRPDLICTIDFAPNNATHLDDLLAVEDVPLVSLCRAYPGLIRDYQGPIFVNGAVHSIPNYLDRLWRHKGVLMTGNSVSHMAFSLANQIGADPIILVGMDMAFSKTTTHFDQVDRNARLDGSGKNIIRRQVMDPKSELHQKKLGETPRFLVPGYYGGQVQTIAPLLSFLTLMERMIEIGRARYINATEGGAKIKGAEPMSLDEVIETVCTQEIDKSGLTDKFSSCEDGEELVDQILPLLKRDLDRIEELLVQCRRGLATNHGLAKLLERQNTKIDAPNGAFQRLMEVNTRTSNRAHELSNQVTAVSMGLVAMSHRIMRRDLNVEFDPQDEEIIKTRLIRNANILKAARETAAKAQGFYQTTYGLIERYLACRNAANDNAADLVALGSVLEEMGDVLGAAESYARAVKIDSRDPLAWEAKIRLEIKRERMAQAEADLKKLARLKGGRKPARDLRREMEERLASWLDNESDFELGTFVRPLVNIRKYLAARKDDPEAKAQETKASEMMAVKIREAEESRKMILEGEAGRQWRYIELINESRRLGRDEHDLEAALACLEEAVKIYPEKAEARWGLATTLHHLGRLPEAKAAYQALVRDFPDRPRFLFELGLLTVNTDQDRLLEGMRYINEAMGQSNKFDTFLPKLGDLYRCIRRPDEALKAYDRFLTQFEADYETWTRRGDCLCTLGRFDDAAESYRKALTFRPDFQPALTNLTRIRGGLNGFQSLPEPGATRH